MARVRAPFIAGARAIGSLSRGFWLTIVAIVAVVAVIYGGNAIVNATKYRTYHAYFNQVIGLYSGDPVEMLGVKVGTVTHIDAGPSSVRVTLRVEKRIKVPEPLSPNDVTAVIVAQSLVSGRFVQIVPHDGQPSLPDGADIAAEHTAVPVEWDQLKEQLDKLATSLGPQGTDKGSLARAIDVAAKNFDGTGATIRSGITELANVLSTLADHRNDIVGTITNLQKLTSALSDSHQQLVQFNGRIADVSQVLADNTTNINGALVQLNDALGEVRNFINTNGSALTTATSNLADATSLLSENDQNIQGILHSAPNQLANFYNIFNPRVASLGGVFALGNGNNLINLVCSTIAGSDRPESDGDAELCVDTFGPILANMIVNYPPIIANPVAGAVAEPEDLTYQSPDVQRRAQAGEDINNKIDAQPTGNQPAKDLWDLLRPAPTKGGR